MTASTDSQAAPLEVVAAARRGCATGSTGCEVDALLVTNLANVRYLSGFTGSAGVLVVTGKARAAHHRRPLPDPGGRAGRSGRAGRRARDRDRQRRGPARRGRRRMGAAGAAGWASRPRTCRGRLQRAGREVFGPRRGRAGHRRGRGAARGEGRRRAGYRMAGRPPSPTPPSPRCCRCWPTPTRRRHRGASSRSALDTAMRRRRGRGPRLRDDRGVGPELGQAPRPAVRRPSSTPGRAGGGRLRGHLRGLPLGHDPDVLRRRRADRRAGPGVRGGAPSPRRPGWPRCGPGWRRRTSTACAARSSREAGWADAFEHGTGHGVGLDIHEAPTVRPAGHCYPRPPASS